MQLRALTSHQKEDPMTNPSLRPTHAVVNSGLPDGDRASSPMTEVQAAKLRDLCEKTGEKFDTALTQDQAAERIEFLKKRL